MKFTNQIVVAALLLTLGASPALAKNMTKLSDKELCTYMVKYESRGKMGGSGLIGIGLLISSTVSTSNYAKAVVEERERDITCARPRTAQGTRDELEVSYKGYVSNHSLRSAPTHIKDWDEAWVCRQIPGDTIAKFEFYVAELGFLTEGQLRIKDVNKSEPQAVFASTSEDGLYREFRFGLDNEIDLFRNLFVIERENGEGLYMEFEEKDGHPTHEVQYSCLIDFV